MSAPKKDLDGNPIVTIKCAHCGKGKGNHQAATFNCPTGLKHRVIGYTSFHHVNKFTPKGKP